MNFSLSEIEGIFEFSFLSNAPLKAAMHLLTSYNPFNYNFLIK